MSLLEKLNDLCERGEALNHPMVRAVDAFHFEGERAFSIDGKWVSCGVSSNLEPVRDMAQQCIPWRKGPFKLAGVEIDSEWRSDLKWDRIADSLPNLSGAEIIDLGTNNGYSMFRMLEHQPKTVVGLDPIARCVAQFRLAQKLAPPTLPIHFKALGWQDLADMKAICDVVFSMGILYHHSDPVYLLKLKKKWLRKGGSLILETIVIPGDEEKWILPRDRYARMRNVYFLPTVPALATLLERCGFSDVQLLESHIHTSEEQRTTAWAPGPSYREFLDPDFPNQTEEGLPAPLRCTFLAR